MAGKKMSPRAARVSGLIQRVIATAVQRDLRDPRLEHVTITEVRVTNDLQIARVYWTYLGDSGKEQGQTKRAKQALKQASGRLRAKVGRAAGLRLTPELVFIYDEVPAEATEVEDVLVAARHRDEELAKAREGATYAGEADPYRHDDTEEAEEDEGDAGIEIEDLDESDDDESEADLDDEEPPHDAPADEGGDALADDSAGEDAATATGPQA